MLAPICENFISLKKSPAEIFEIFPTHIAKKNIPFRLGSVSEKSQISPQVIFLAK